MGAENFSQTPQWLADCSGLSWREIRETYKVWPDLRQKGATCALWYWMREHDRHAGNLINFNFENYLSLLRVLEKRFRAWKTVAYAVEQFRSESVENIENIDVEGYGYSGIRLDRLQHHMTERFGEAFWKFVCGNDEYHLLRGIDNPLDLHFNSMSSTEMGKDWIYGSVKLIAHQNPIV